MASFGLFRHVTSFSSASFPRIPQRCRGFSVATQLSNSSKTFGQSPSPPRLPKEEQEIFERLQRESTGAFSTPRSQETESDQSGTSQLDTSADGEAQHPDVRKGSKPDFEGDTNPRTGEVGGPKNEPLRWGAEGDWSYNGRVTDF